MEKKRIITIFLVIFFLVVLILKVKGNFAFEDDFDANEGSTGDGFAWVGETLSYYIVSTPEDDLVVWDFGLGDSYVVWIKTGQCQACRSNWSWLDDYCDISCGSDEETCVILADPAGTLGYINTSSIGREYLTLDTYSCDGSGDNTWHGTVAYNIINQQQYDCNSCNWKTESCLLFDYEGDSGIFRDIVEDVSCPANTECDDLIDKNVSTTFNEELTSVCRLVNSQACSTESDCLTDICSGGLCGLDDGETTCSDIYDCRDNNCISGMCRNCTSDSDCSGSNPYCDTDGSAPNPEEYMCSCWNRNSPDTCDECLDEGLAYLCDCDEECASGRCDGGGSEICMAQLVNGNACDEDSDCISGICNEDNLCGDCYDSGDCSEPTPYCDTDASYSPNYECGCWDTAACNQCLDYADGFLCDCDAECDSGLVCHTGYSPAPLCKPPAGGGFPCTKNNECNTGVCSGGFCTYEEISLVYDILPSDVTNCSTYFGVDVSGSTTDENAKIIYSCYSFTGGIYYDDCYSKTESDCTNYCPNSNWSDYDWNITFNFTSAIGGFPDLKIKLGDNVSDTATYTNSTLCFYCFPYFCGETCYDGIKNQDENSTDCGGICGYCDNGIKDYWETEVDYGGTCGTCRDGVKNSVCGIDLENEIDYGGRCGTCSDGSQSIRLGETTIDYGGVCGNCYNNQLDTLINETEIDYGGYFCGYCDLTLTKEEDELWSIAKELDKSIPFPTHWCEEGQAALIIVNFVIIILIGISVIGAIFVIGLVIFFIISNSAALITLIASVRRIYKGLLVAERIKKGNYTKKELLRQAWNIYRTEKFK